MVSHCNCNCSCRSTHAPLSDTRSDARQGPEHTLLLLRVTMLPGKRLHAIGAACSTTAAATAGRHFTGQQPSASWGEHPGTPESAQRGVQCCRRNRAEQAQHGIARHCAAQHSTTRHSRPGQAIDRTRQQHPWLPPGSTRQRLSEQPGGCWSCCPAAAGVGMRSQAILLLDLGERFQEHKCEDHVRSNAAGRTGVARKGGTAGEQTCLRIPHSTKQPRTAEQVHHRPADIAGCLWLAGARHCYYHGAPIYTAPHSAR